MRLFLSLIFALYANASFALSIGEATLKSYLGESLIVKLNVTDVEKSPDSNCFTITDTNDTPAFRKAFSTLTPYKDGYQLTITTQSTITEPILGLRVSYHCEPQLDRDYVLLLDPAPQHSEPLNETSTVSQVNEAGKQVASNAEKTNLATQPLAKADLTSNVKNNPQLKAKRKPKKQPSSTLSNADEKMMESYVGKAQATAKEQPAAIVAKNRADTAPSKPSDTSKPYLSISGGNLTSGASGGQANLGLKFETQIDLNRAPPIAPIDSTELMDEVTVMSNRLTHLEKQIISLQAQNTQLRNEATIAKNALAEQEASTNWLNYLLIAGAVALFVAAFIWLRRIWFARRAIKQELDWQNTDLSESNDFEPTFTPSTMSAHESTQAKNTSFSKSFLDEQDYDDEKIEPTKPRTLTTAEHVSEEHDSIIDNADVFIEHERPLLAIQLLQNHLNDYPTESPKIWIKLLSLIASEGSESEYEAVVADAKKYFNIRVPSYSDAKNEDISSIEDFPNIVARLEGVWGSPFAVKFLNDLIYDQHAQPAAGFSPNNFDELFFLKKIAELLNTGVSTTQRTLYRTAATTNLNSVNNESDSKQDSSTNLDNLAFNEAAFADASLFESAAPTETVGAVSNHTVSDEDFTVASLPEPSEPSKLSRFSMEDAHAEFENSPFQKVPSYDVDVLVDFDEHIETNAPTADAPLLNEAQNSTPIVLDAEEDSFKKDDSPQETVDSFHFPLNVYPEDIVMEDSATDDPQTIVENDKSLIKKEKDSNIIEWDLPKLDS